MLRGTPSSQSETHSSQNFKVGGTPSAGVSSHTQGRSVDCDASRGGSRGSQSGAPGRCSVVCCDNTALTQLAAEVLSEEPILKWYKDAHLAKGKSVFLEQMKKFVEWLKNAEEGNQQLSSQAEVVRFGNLSAIMLCFGGWGVNCWSETGCAPQYWLEKLAGEIHVDPVAAVYYRGCGAGAELGVGGR